MAIWGNIFVAASIGTGLLTVALVDIFYFHDKNEGKALLKYLLVVMGSLAVGTYFTFLFDYFG